MNPIQHVYQVPVGNYLTDLVVEIHPVDPRDTYTYTTAFLYVKDAHHVTVNDVNDEELPNDLQVRIGDDNGVINSSPDQ